MTDNIEYRGYIIEIKQDDYPENPREWDNLGTMALYHSRYRLGDKDKPATPQDLFDIVDSGSVIAVEVKSYEHTVFVLAAGPEAYRYPFTDRWDASMLGYIYVDRQQVRKEFGWKRLTRKREERIIKILIYEVKEYSNYLNGDVWGYRILSPEGEEVMPFTFGYYGSPDFSGLLQEAKGEIDCLIRKEK